MVERLSLEVGALARALEQALAPSPASSSPRGRVARAALGLAGSLGGLQATTSLEGQGDATWLLLDAELELAPAPSRG